MNYWWWWRLLTPLTVVTLSGVACPISRDYGSQVSIRPPSYLFGIVWFVLLLCIGYAWASSPSPATDGAFVLLLVLLSSYSLSTSRPIASLWIVYGCIAAALLCFALLETSASRACMAPVIGWLLFAAQLAKSIACEECTPPPHLLAT